MICLVSLDKETKEYQKKKADFDKYKMKKEKAESGKGNSDYKKETMAPHYFTMMKQLTLLGFFTSKHPGHRGPEIYSCAGKNMKAVFLIKKAQGMGIINFKKNILYE